MYNDAVFLLIQWVMAMLKDVANLVLHFLIQQLLDTHVKEKQPLAALRDMKFCNLDVLTGA